MREPLRLDPHGRDASDWGRRTLSPMHDHNDHLAENQDRYEAEELRLLRELETVVRACGWDLPNMIAIREIDYPRASVTLQALDRHREER